MDAELVYYFLCSVKAFSLYVMNTSIYKQKNVFCIDKKPETSLLIYSYVSQLYIRL